MTRARTRLSSAVVAGLALLVVMQMAVAPVAAASLETADPTGEQVPNPFYSGQVTKATHEVGDMGPLEYYNNSNELAQMPATVNDSADEPIEYTVTDVELDDFGAFPHSKENVTALEATGWTESGLTVRNAETADNVRALTFVTGGSMSSGSTASASYDNFSLETDENKRYLSIAADVNTLDSSARVEIRAMTADGDYKAVVIDSDENAADDNVLADGTGEGYVEQVRLGDLAVQGSGDGTFDNIESVNVVVTDGDADVSVNLLNLDRTAPYVFGERVVQTGDDDETTETEEIVDVNTPGPIGITGEGTIGSDLQSAVIHNYVVDFHARAQDLSAEDRKANVTNAEGYDYSNLVTVHYRMSLPTAYELSYAQVTLEGATPVPELRFASASIATGVGDTEFTEISDNSYQSVTDAYGSKDKQVTIDDTINPASTQVYRASILTDNPGQFTGEVGGGGGGLLGFGGGDGFIQGIIAAILGLFGINRMRGG